MIDTDRYTETAREAVVFARHEAGTRGYVFAAPYHLLMALAGQEGTIPRRAFDALGVTRERIVAAADSVIPARGDAVKLASVGLQQDTERMLGDAPREATMLGQGFVGPEHLLLAMLHSATDPTLTGKVLRAAGVAHEELIAKLEQLIGVSLAHHLVATVAMEAPVPPRGPVDLRASFERCLNQIDAAIAEFRAELQR